MNVSHQSMYRRAALNVRRRRAAQEALSWAASKRLQLPTRWTGSAAYSTGGGAGPWLRMGASAGDKDPGAQSQSHQQPPPRSKIEASKKRDEKNAKNRTKTAQTTNFANTGKQKKTRKQIAPPQNTQKPTKSENFAKRERSKKKKRLVFPP